MITLPAISLWQPWASLWVCGPKQIETRNWGTNYRGWLVVHAAQQWSRAQRDFARRPDVAPLLLAAGLDPNDLPRGGLIGQVDLLRCEQFDRDLERQCFVMWGLEAKLWPEIERQLGDCTPGRWGWLRGEARPFRLRPYKGARGLFQVPANLIPAEIASHAAPRL